MSAETIIDKENQTKTANCSGHVEPVVSCEFLKSIKNKVASTTGDSVTNKSIILIIYLHEQHKQSVNSN